MTDNSKVKKHKVLVSKRHDLSSFRTPEMTWDFYDSYNSSKQATVARDNAELSTYKDNLEKYLVETTLGGSLQSKMMKQLLHVDKSTGPYAHLEAPFPQLLALQNQMGKFEDLEQVLKLLTLPSWIRVSSDKSSDCTTSNLSTWEQATALAVSYMRQHPHLFDDLFTPHDKASQWLTSNELVYSAREVIMKYYGKGIIEEEGKEKEKEKEKQRELEMIKETEKDGIKNNKNISTNKNSNKQQQHGRKAVDVFFLQEPLSTSLSFLTSNLKTPTAPVPLHLHNITSSLDSSNGWVVNAENDEEIYIVDAVDNNDNENNNNENNNNENGSDDDEDDDEDRNDVKVGDSGQYNENNNEDEKGEQANDEVDGAREDEDTEELEWMRNNNTVLQSSSSSSSPSSLALPTTAKEARLVVMKLQMQVIKCCLDVEDHVKKIVICKDKCVSAFNSCETYGDRNLCFDELTAMLGDDVAPREGFLEGDWRKDGVKGYRPIVINFLIKVHELAEARLLYEELNNPFGRSQSLTAKVMDGGRSRWSLTWNGIEMITKILYSLNFLRECKELADWYGKKISLLANPLMLPFNMQTGLERLGMQAKVMEHIQSKAHVRLGSAQIGGVQHWTHHKYLSHFGKRFKELSEETHMSNWPNIPRTLEAEDRSRLYTAMLVLYIRSSEAVSSMAAYEKQFVALLATVRGQHLMKGKSGVKPHRQLPLPLTHDELTADEHLLLHNFLLEQKAISQNHHQHLHHQQHQQSRPHARIGNGSKGVQPSNEHNEGEGKGKEKEGGKGKEEGEGEGETSPNALGKTAVTKLSSQSRLPTSPPSPSPLSKHSPSNRKDGKKRNIPTSSSSSSSSSSSTSASASISASDTDTAGDGGVSVMSSLTIPTKPRQHHGHNNNKTPLKPIAQPSSQAAAAAAVSTTTGEGELAKESERVKSTKSGKRRPKSSSALKKNILGVGSNESATEEGGRERERDREREVTKDALASALQTSRQVTRTAPSASTMSLTRRVVLPPPQSTTSSSRNFHSSLSHSSLSFGGGGRSGGRSGGGGMVGGPLPVLLKPSSAKSKKRS